MTTRTFTDKNGNEWFWEETPETIEALKKVNKPSVVITDLTKPHNYQGPLYAPHPELKDGKQETN